MRLPIFTALSLLFVHSLLFAANDRALVGLQADGSIIVPTNQTLKPAGKQVTFPGRPVDLALSADGKTLYVKNMGEITFIDIETSKVRSALPLGKKELFENIDMGKVYEGFSVCGLIATESKIFVSNSQSALSVAEKNEKGLYKWGKDIALPKPAIGGQAHPAGMFSPSEGKVWVTATRGNCVHLVDLETAKVIAAVETGIAPYGVCAPLPEKVFVTNWGGDFPKKDDPQAKSSGTMARVDPRTSVVNDGTVAVLALSDGRWTKTKSISVGLHPSAIIASRGGKFVYIANANSDTVSVISTASDTLVETIHCRPEAKLPFGSGSNALALSPDGTTLYVANATNNCIAVVQFGSKAGEAAAASVESKLRGLIPTGWYPGALALSADGKKLFVANVKGHGLLSNRRAKEKGKASQDFLGSISIIDVPDEKQLAEFTKTVNDNNRLALSISGMEPPRAGIAPAIIPERHGEPSVFKHVVYIIKENKTYDQVFGDMKEGDGDKSLCIFPEKVTPNAHALAREFTLFDNFYCSGSKSPDGHSWVNEAYVTDYLEKQYGGFTRSYPYEGSDPLAFAPTGFLWDNALAHKKTFFNYGEYCKTTYTPKAKWKEIYEDFKNGTNKIKISVEPNMQSLKPYSHPAWPGFPLLCSDAYRAKLFKEEMVKYEEKNEFPNLVYVFLPQDHTSGTSVDFPTPKAMVADNDAALGQIVESISSSKFWKETCIIVVQDDPQSGYDHVDGHRSVAFVISPYTKRKFVDHTNYNQTGLVKTIELILGLPPMTQLDLSATPLRNCFQDQPDLTPFKAREAQMAIDELNGPAKPNTKAAFWQKKSAELSFEEADEADDDTLNRIIWFAMKGDKKYPEGFGGDDDDDD